MRAVRWVAVALLGVALAGCDSTGSPPPGSTPSPGTSAPSTPPGTPSPSATRSGPPDPGTPPAAAPLVEFGRTGGIAGVDERLTVWTDGTYLITRRRDATTRGRLTASELADLRRVLDEARFAQVPAVNPGNYVDGYTYRVVYGGHEVLAEDGGIPQVLDRVIGTLNGLLSRR